MKPSKWERAIQIILALLKSLCYLALFLGMQVVIMLPATVSIIIQEILGNGRTDESTLYEFLENNAMTFSFISGVLTLAVILIFYCICKKKLSEALWLRRVPASVLWEGAALAPGLYLVVILVLSALPQTWIESYSEASAGLDAGGVLGVLSVVVVAPIVEEFVFRGLIMTRLSYAMPGWLAILLSAAIFGGCHGHPIWFAYAFFLGMVFGLMDWKAGSIWPSILGHMTFNAIGQIFTFLPEPESSTGEVIMMIVLLVVAVIAAIADRRAIAALFCPAKKQSLQPAWEISSLPNGAYEFNPWEE